jgi:single-strand DNA-binding protein
MSKGFNQQIIVGNLGGDAEVRYVGEKGTAKTTFSVASTTGNGNYEHTEWFNIAIWGKRGEALSEYLTKGKKVMVTGETRTQKWQNNAGETQYYTEVVVSPYKGDIVLLGGKQQSRSSVGPVPPPPNDEEEIPF